MMMSVRLVQTLKKCCSPGIIVFLLILTIDGLLASPESSKSKPPPPVTFRAGVVQITPSRTAYMEVSDAQWEMQKSLDSYEAYVKDAKKVDDDVQIVVFPQHGIHGIHTRKSTLKRYLHIIDPGPETKLWEPCEYAKEKEPSSTLWRLSCMAKNNKLHIVANIAEKEVCNRTLDSNCPGIGYYIYSTTVCFDASGQFVARHRACHLSFSDQVVYNKHEPCDYFPVSTQFGTLGLATGYDLVYRDPAIILTDQFKVDHLVVPVAWRDKLPFDVATGFHQAFAKSRGVNLLAANLDIQMENMEGSGIYSPKGAQVVTKRGKYDTNLLLAKLHKNPRAQQSNHYVLQPMLQTSTKQKDGIHSIHSIKISRYATASVKMLDLTKMTHNISVCQGQLCCSFRYTITSASNTELFVAGTYNGIFGSSTVFQAEMCFLIKCLSMDLKSCGEPVNSSTTSFKNIVIHGNYRAHYIYGQILRNNGELLTDKWHCRYKTLWTNSTVNVPLLAAVLTGRPYHLDDRIINDSELIRSNLYRNGAPNSTHIALFSHYFIIYVFTGIYLIC